MSQLAQGFGRLVTSVESDSDKLIFTYGGVKPNANFCFPGLQISEATRQQGEWPRCSFVGGNATVLRYSFFLECWRGIDTEKDRLDHTMRRVSGRLSHSYY